MHSKNLLPFNTSWIHKIEFNGDVQHESNCLVSCVYTCLDDVTGRSQHEHEARLKDMIIDIQSVIVGKKHACISNNMYWQTARQKPDLSLDELLRFLIDGLSHAHDDINPKSHFRPYDSSEGKALCQEYLDLICDDQSNLLPAFTNLLHQNFTFLPVRDLENTKSGRIGVESMTHFLNDPLSHFSRSVMNAEEKLKTFVYEAMRERFPKYLRQFVVPNSSLILLRLFC